METINVEKVIINQKYKAYDGTIFESSNECRDYENSAECAVKVAYSHYVIKETNAEELFGGDPDHQVDIVKFDTPEARKTVIQLMSLVNSFSEVSSDMQAKIESYIIDGTPVFIGWNYDKDYMWFIGSTASLIGKLKLVAGLD